MSRRTMAVVILLVMVVSILAVASVLWAAKAAPKGGDFTRCLTTCDTVMKYYSAQRPTLKAHEGDKQCWATCDARLNHGRNAGNVQAMKAFWTEQRPNNLHANQCAQACWRRFHKGSDLVTASGLHNSAPRSVACTPEGLQRAQQQFAGRKPA